MARQKVELHSVMLPLSPTLEKTVVVRAQKKDKKIASRPYK
ncbi:hypothetical protein BLL52_2270 [Rhodoferax antarcticus ANT.BR]|uniref:Uncharacterized protein n=1 Tax=Rhodoferax antarcticus ANT.BR TaxID=1111071 RepID=A0A1Q8YDY8_9BURK|nr:hypothetical protein BLL52_2270 [Rhodoferax antarcticus ANT.BR]